MWRLCTVVHFHCVLVLDSNRMSAMQQLRGHAGRSPCSRCQQQQRLRGAQPRMPPAQLQHIHIDRRRSCLAANSSNAAATAGAAAGTAAATMTVYFRDEDVSTTAAAGDDLIEVAAGCGVSIPTGCWQGNCGVCEVEVYKYPGAGDTDSSAATSAAAVRACITKLPPGYSRVEIAQMQDAIWGLDGFDT